MLYLVEVVGENYKVYDSSTEDVFMVDVKYLESNAVLGVVPLSHRLMAISEVSKAEQKALNLLDIDFRYLRDRSTNEWLGNYVYGEVLQEMSVNFLDLIYSSLHEETSQALSKLNKVGTAEFYADTGYDHRIYRSTYKVSDLAKFELAYTKYKILQR